MFARPGRCVSQIGPGPNTLIPANSIWSPYPDASSLPAVNFVPSRNAGRDRTRQSWCGLQAGPTHELDD